MLTKTVFYHQAIGFCAVLLMAGCGQSNPDSSRGPEPGSTAPASSDPDDVHITADDVERPENYAAAVDRIKAYRDTIRDEIAAGRPGKAHRPLDEANYVLEWLPEIVQESGIAKEHWETINLAAQTVRESFDQIHTRIDGQQEPDFEAVAADVQQAIETLESAVAAGQPAVSPDEDESGEAPETSGEAS